MQNIAQILSKITRNCTCEFGASMAERTSFSIGGPAECLVRPYSVQEAAHIYLAAAESSMACTILGAGSNILVSDEGIKGLVIDTTRLSEIVHSHVESGKVELAVQCGYPIDALCDYCVERGWSGLEYMAGLPGTLGGALYMNARCYDREISDIVSWASFARRAMPSGPGFSHNAEAPLWQYSHCQDDWAYKRSVFQKGGRAEGSLILEACVVLTMDDPNRLRAIALECRRDRQKKGHFLLPCAGSMFKNNRSFGRPTGAILDSLGFKGMRVGDAMVSPLHANIFVNAGWATAHDILSLAGKAAQAARESLGIELEAEVELVGDFAAEK